MTWNQINHIATENRLHVRRESWPAEKWFYKADPPALYGALWFVFITNGTEKERNGTQVVRCTDYNAEDLLATDWTTVPAALTSCPVVPPAPGDPGSPGGRPPGPGDPGFPDPGPGFPPIIFPPSPGEPAGGGSGPAPLPAPDPGASLRVSFHDVHLDTGVAIHGFEQNKTRTLEGAGPNHWQSEFDEGYIDTEDQYLSWRITADRTDDVDQQGIWMVFLQCTGRAGSGIGIATGGFSNDVAHRRNQDLANSYTGGGSLTVYGGFARVL